MKALVVSSTMLFGLLLSGAFGFIALAVVAAGGAGSAAAAATVSNPSEEAISDIPPLLLALFIDEAQRYGAATPQRGT